MAAACAGMSEGRSRWTEQPPRNQGGRFPIRPCEIGGLETAVPCELESFSKSAEKAEDIWKIRVVRAIRGEPISAFPRKVFGSADRSGEDRTLDRAGAARE